MGLNARAHALATQLFWWVFRLVKGMTVESRVRDTDASPTERYTRRDPQHVERHLISDYRNSIAVAVEKDSVHESHREVVMSAIPVSSTKVSPLLVNQRNQTRDHSVHGRPAFQRPVHSPFEGGPRLALLYLAFEALRAYGVLDEKVRRQRRKINKLAC